MKLDYKANFGYEKKFSQSKVRETSHITNFVKHKTHLHEEFKSLKNIVTNNLRISKGKKYR